MRYITIIAEEWNTNTGSGNVYNEHTSGVFDRFELYENGECLVVPAYLILLILTNTHFQHTEGVCMSAKLRYCIN